MSTFRLGRIFFALIFFVGVTYFAMVCRVQASEVPLSDAERAYIQDNPTLRVANEMAWPPFNFSENGEAKGYSIDYIRLIAQKLGLKVEFVRGPSWGMFMGMIRTGDIDVIMNIIPSDERRAYINFTSAYVISSAALYTKGRHSDITTLDSLNGKTVAVPAGYISQELLTRKYPNIKQYLTTDTAEALQAVAKGEVDAVISDTGVAEHLIRKLKLESLVNTTTISDPMFVNVLSIGVRKDRALLLTILQKGMDAVSDEETLRLREQWLSPSQGSQVRSPLAFTEGEKAYLAAHDEITMCIDPDWMPYEKFDADGKHIGMTADYFDAFALRIGKPIHVVKTKTWPQSLDAARKRVCDIMSLVMKTEERRAYLDFTAPYLVSPMVIATHPHAPFIADIPSIGDHVVGIVKGYAFVSVFRHRYPDIHVVEVNNINDGLDKVRNGELFGMIDTLATIGYAIQQNYIGELKIVGKFEDTLNLSVGVRNDAPELLSIFNKVIDSLTPEQHRAIRNAWISVHYEEAPDYTLLIQVIIAFMIISVLMVYWQIQLRKHNAVLERLSNTDRLTGLFNRLKLDEMMEMRHAEFARFGRPFSIILLDIDNFKLVNDRFGHQMGDRVLVKAASLLKDQSRTVDSVGRWGGEEFLIICPETRAEGAKVQAEYIRAAFKSTDFGTGDTITVSLGIAEMGEGEGVKDVILRADAALYTGKNNGRDQVCVAAPRPGSTQAFTQTPTGQ
ncbi:transporter substrate-binding domain-containing diguanylate cyclase [Magnetovibrio blakemorei]|uniref:GGDEF domain-containing protein n=1 Tax=Magnetovibrio blakemorei TaxID=28181 RepID=A0A1E5QAK5_9PROT|nr:transporter substrate-binding domain-containing protein [Magnetovibrio blakemorei]OEJ68885.1 hypothetical protein BEN30_05080 [Magnetovibrio blakemorei]